MIPGGRIFCTVAVILGGLSVAFAADYPTKPIKVVVPFGAGGNSDIVMRDLQKSIEQNKFLSQPLVIVNVPGAGGSIGARQVKDADPDGYTILLYHNSMLVQQANGMADYGYKDFAPIASVGVNCQVPAVMQDSPYKSLKDLLEAAKAKPGTIPWGGNLGGSNHMAILALEHAAPGAEFRKVQVGGDADSFAALKGQVVQVATFGVGAFEAYKASGVRALALLADKREATEPDLPTAMELGYDASYCEEHVIYAPKGTPPDRVAILAKAIQSALATDDVRQQFKELGKTTDSLSGAALDEHLAKELEKVKPLALMAAPK